MLPSKLIKFNTCMQLFGVGTVLADTSQVNPTMTFVKFSPVFQSWVAQYNEYTVVTLDLFVWLLMWELSLTDM